MPERAVSNLLEINTLFLDAGGVLATRPGRA